MRRWLLATNTYADAVNEESDGVNGFSPSQIFHRPTPTPPLMPDRALSGEWDEPREGSFHHPVCTKSCKAPCYPETIPPVCHRR